MKRRILRLGLYAGGGVAALALAAAIAAVVTLQSPWFREQVRLRIISEIERATGGRTELKSFAFDWRRLTATARGFVLHGTEPEGEAPLGTAESVEVGLKIVSILKRDIDIEFLTVKKPAFHLIVSDDGRTNIPEPKIKRTAKGGTIVDELVKLAIGRVNLENGTVTINVTTVPLDLHGENLRAALAYELPRQRYSGDVSFRKLTLNAPARGIVPLDVDATVALERNRIEVSSARAAMGASYAVAHGTLTDLRSPRIEFDYTAHARMDEIVPALHLPVPPKGMATLAGKAFIHGSSEYKIAGKLSAAGLAFEERGIRIRNISAVSDVTATPNRLALENMTLSALGGRIRGNAVLADQRRFQIDSVLSGLSVEELGRVENPRRAVWNALLSGPVKVNGELRDGKPAGTVVDAALTVEPASGAAPVHGSINAVYRQRAGTVELAPSQLFMPSSRVELSGILGKRLEVAASSGDLADFQPAIEMLSTGTPPAIPVKLDGGNATFRGTVNGPLDDPRIEGRVSANKFLFEGHPVDNLEAGVAVAQDGVTIDHADVRRQSIRLTGGGKVALRKWKAEDSAPLSGAFELKAPSLPVLLAEAGAKLPLSGGNLDADFEIGGTVGDPSASGHAQSTKLTLYDQPLDKIEADLTYRERLVEVSEALAQSGPDRIRFRGLFEHPENDWERGTLRFEVPSAELSLARSAALQKALPKLEGAVHGYLSGEISLTPSQDPKQLPFRVHYMNGAMSVQRLGVAGDVLGNLQIESKTATQAVNLTLKGELAGAAVNGSTQVRLENDYPVQGSLRFDRLAFSEVLARIGKEQKSKSPFSGFAEGKAEFSGLALRPETLKAVVDLPLVEIRPRIESAANGRTADMTLRNNGPVQVELTPKRARLVRAQFTAKDTTLAASGTLAFGAKEPWNMRVQGGINLALLRSIDNDLYPEGAVTLDATVRGPLGKPELYGQVDLKDASVNYTGMPNGISNANGRIFLYRDRAMIDRMTAETGGGKLAVSGFMTLAGAASFHLQAKADQVRIRYPEGVSSSSNATLSLTGTTDRSRLSGDVTITRIGFNPRTDLGSILARSAQPLETPAPKNKFMQGLTFDVRLRTAPQVRVETQLTRDVQAEADLQLRGDVTRPALLGRALISQGEIVFFGNQFTINSGEILFVNPSRIQPVVNLDLETRARGIDVTLNVSGPINKLNFSYRSDPPLQYSDIIALLATGRAPAAASSGLAGAQTTASSSWQQSQAGAIVGNAIASPIAGRLQRFFGVSRLKIDPTVTGVTSAEGNPLARVTLEQQLSSNVTFTYITDLSRAQAQTIRVQWDLNKHWSGVMQREENGLFGVDLLYKKQFK